MELSIADRYYLKAVDYYPHDLENVIENLQYALGYSDEHAPSLCMMGKVQMYALKDYNKARICLNQALRCDDQYPDTYEYLTQVHIWLGRYDMAIKVINYAAHIPGVDHCTMLRLRASIAEYRGQYKAARQILRQAEVIASQANCIHLIHQDIKRIKSKSKLLKSSRRVKMHKKTRSE